LALLARDGLVRIGWHVVEATERDEHDGASGSQAGGNSQGEIGDPGPVVDELVLVGSPSEDFLDLDLARDCVPR
jgi:hypothetical protein